jgi:hypothetical protein
VVIRVGLIALLSAAMSGCAGGVRFLTTKCSLSDGAVVSMESKSYSAQGPSKAPDPALILPNNISFDNLPLETTIAISSEDEANRFLSTASVDGWHVGSQPPTVKSHYVAGTGVFARIDFVEPGRLSLIFTNDNPFADGHDRPDSAFTIVSKPNLSLRVNDFIIDSNWLQSEIVSSNKSLSSKENAGRFSTPDQPEFEIRTPPRISQ